MMKMVDLGEFKKETIVTPTGVYEVAVVDSAVLSQDTSEDTLGKRDILLEENGYVATYDEDDYNEECGSNVSVTVNMYHDSGDYDDESGDSYDLMEEAYNADFGYCDDEDDEDDDDFSFGDYALYAYMVENDI